MLMRKRNSNAIIISTFQIQKHRQLWWTQYNSNLWRNFFIEHQNINAKKMKKSFSSLKTKKNNEISNLQYLIANQKLFQKSGNSKNRGIS